MVRRRASAILARLRSLAPILRLAPRLILGRRSAVLPVPPELAPLTASVRETSSSAVISQAQPVSIEETLALVAGCWGSERRVQVEWPASLVSEPRGRSSFVAWHRAVIGHGILPYVVVSERVPPSGEGR